MGKPLLIYGLCDLLNWSFEDGLTNWDTSLSVNGLNTSATDEYHSAGSGLPSVKSLRQNVSASPTTNKAICAQRVLGGDLLNVARLNGGEIAVAAMIKHAAPAVQNSVHLEIKQYAGSTLTVGEGTEKTPPSSRTFLAGEGPEWLMLVTAQQVHADTTHLEVHLRYQLATSGDYDAGNYAWWDRVFIGGLVDFPKGVRDFELSPDAGYVVNVGDGVAEIVKLTAPSTSVSLSIVNILENSAFDLSIKRFLRLMGGSEPGICAFWGDRDRFTNGERHFQRMALNPERPKIEYPPGVTRRIHKFQMLAYAEFTD